ncbi:Exportin-6 [Tyrophagus putrescentiae]|nr:Exportin-6 [Tyrophagus putrescentiae]
MADTQKTHLNGSGLHYSSSNNCKDISAPPVDEETLSRLESLMNEFFYPNTSNERKRQIESILSEFSSMPNSWQASFLYFELSSNEYTQMFCLTVIETFINQRWHTVPSDMRATFRNSLWNHLMEHQAQMTNPIRNKFCKIMVSIARFDWPYAYADYMTNVLELLTPENVHNIAHSSTHSLILLSLNLLGMTVEELTSPSCNNHFSSNRQVELIKLVESNLPAMLHSLTALLEVIISKQINFISATPPPSPTSSPSSTFGNLNKANDTLNSVFQMSIKKGLFESIPDMDSNFVQMTAQILSCLSRIIAFMPSTYYSNLNQTLLSALYVFANFGCFNPSYNSAKLGLAAMVCINELMSKASAFNSDTNEFIYNVFHNTFLILQRIITSVLKVVPNGEDTSLTSEPDEEYLKKFIDFLKLFIGGHLGRFEKFISFPTKDFLTLLLEFTTKMHHSLECYLMLLEVWSIYLDYLESCQTVKHKDKGALSEKLQEIKEPIFSLLLFMIRSIQYSCNLEYLQQLDDCTVDDDDRTEFEQYVQTSIETIAKIGDIYSEETIGYIDSYFNEKLQSIHYGLEFFVNNKSAVVLNGHHSNSSSGKLFSAEMCQQPLGQLQLSIYDFITTLQVISRFSHCFVDDNCFEKYFSRTRLIFDKLFEILQFLEAQHCCDVYHLNALSAEFFLLKAQLLATFKAYIVWFQQLSCHSLSPDIKATDPAVLLHGGGVEGSTAATEAMLTTIFNTCSSIICDTSLVEVRHGAGEVTLAKRKLFHSAALTLNTFSTNVRPAMVFALSSVQRLFDQNILANVLQLCDINSNINDSSGGSHGGSVQQQQQQQSSSGKEGKGVGLQLDCSSQPSVSVTDQILISQAISNLLILPWFARQNDSQEWERRSVCLNHFVVNFLQLFNKLNFSSIELADSALLSSSKSRGGRGSGDENRKCPNVFCRSLFILRKVIKSHTDSPVKSKQMLFSSLDSSLEAFTQLLVHNTFLHTTVVGCQITENILALFLVVFDVLLAQMHIEFVKRTIQTLLQIIHTLDVLSPTNGGGAQLQHGSQKENSALKVIIKFLRLLGLIIKQTSFNASLRFLLPGIIDFTVAHIQSNLISVKSTTSIYFNSVSGQSYDTYGKLLRVYYRFLFDLVHNNCRYFFPQSNVNKITFDSGSGATGESNSHQRHFESIMEIFGQSFMQPENIQLYRQNVEALESLNGTIRLYSRASFKSTFLERFLYLFVQTLLDRSLDLLDELLYTIVYHLVEVDFDHFYNAFIPKFLVNIQHLNDMQRSELVANFNIGRLQSATHEAQIDFPTFSANLNRLLCDIRFYHKCNSV